MGIQKEPRHIRVQKRTNSNPATEGRCEYNSKNSVASESKHPASCSNRGSTHTLP